MKSITEPVSVGVAIAPLPVKILRFLLNRQKFPDNHRMMKI